MPIHHVLLIRSKKLLYSNFKLYEFVYRTERRAYYKRREDAAQHPKDKISIILDGMDQR